MVNKKRLIDACEYHKELCKERDFPGRTEEFISAMDVAMADLEDLPIVDAVEVVRCKDCKKYSMTYRNNLLRLGWCMRFDNAMQDDAFCSYGERKDGDSDDR